MAMKPITHNHNHTYELGLVIFFLTHHGLLLLIKTNELILKEILKLHNTYFKTVSSPAK